MSGIATRAIFHVNKLNVVFRDDIGNSISIQGTGFWLQTDRGAAFVTNAHNIDSKLKIGAQSTYVIEKLSICLRAQVNGGWKGLTKDFEISSYDLIKHPTADVAILRNIHFEKFDSLFSYSFFEISDLADQPFFVGSLAPMDMASFIGYPGTTGKPWYDEQWNLSIARTVNIASLPQVAFSNKIIPTSDTLLVSGLSFSGSSGSPIISHEKGINLGEGLTGGAYVRPKLIGIMSGHWNDDKDPLSHSGLSYFTRSTSILEII